MTPALSIVVHIESNERVFFLLFSLGSLLRTV